MKYKNMIEGTFIKRINRFIAEVLVDGQVERVHVKNTGRCKELFIEGKKIFLQKSDNPDRKTKYSLITIYKGDMLVNIDSQVPNKVIYDAIENKEIEGFNDVVELRREVTYGKSRFDLYFKRENGSEGFIEIKGVTLERDGYATFPDAPTERGAKHVRELTEALKEGYESYVIFLIQLKPVSYFTPNAVMDPTFSETLINASKKGVHVLAFDSEIEPDGIHIGRPVPVIFEAD